LVATPQGKHPAGAFNGPAAEAAGCNIYKYMSEKHNREIKKIIGEINCPKDFKCYKSGFDSLCRAKDIGIESFLECLEAKSNECKFSFPFGLMYLCQCPLRIYIAKKMHK